MTRKFLIRFEKSTVLGALFIAWASFGYVACDRQCPPGDQRTGNYCSPALEGSEASPTTGNTQAGVPSTESGASGNGNQQSGSSAPGSQAQVPGSQLPPMAGSSAKPPQGASSSMNSGNTSAGVCPSGAAPTKELCDNADNDCDGKVDEEVSMECGTSDLGVCRKGKKICTAGVWSTTCEGAVEPTAEACDAMGLDENCDGVKNENCSCTPGAQQPCGNANGTCQAGAQTCGAAGQWGMDCVGAVLPKLELCDTSGLDEDCDTRVDEGCECLGTASEACSNAGKGICAIGHHVCQDGKWGACMSDMMPRPEVCDGNPIDEDCDGSPNNGCQCMDGMTQACSGSSVGECKPGTQTCTGGKWSACVDRKEAAPRETACDGKDEDCNQVVDDNAPCASGQRCYRGSCKAWCTDTACMTQSPDPCRPNQCDENTGDCMSAPVARDGIACTKGTIRAGVCRSGTCSPACTDADCASRSTNACMAMKCDTNSGMCVTSGPAADFTVCGLSGGSGSCSDGMCYPVVSIKAAAPERTKTSQLYVSAPNNGAALTATANSVGSWEKYVLISRGGSQIVLRSAASHNFVAQIGANFFATGSTISQAVTLTRHGGDSSVNFQVPGSNYITAPLDNGSDPNNLLGRNSGPLEATRGAADGAPGSWETFSIRNESPEPK